MAEKKSLGELLADVTFSLVGGQLDHHVVISKVQSDSRLVGPQDVFIALRGEINDGHSFVQSVLENSCAAVIVNRDFSGSVVLENPSEIPILSVADTRDVFSQVVASYYDFPQKYLRLVGITGTNGKTSITYLLEHALAELGQRVGIVGTVNYRYTDRDGSKHEYPAPLTTPDPLVLQKMLYEMKQAGVDCVVMEVSSHALIQKRIGDIQFDIAAFTNLTHDHLDYHQNMEEYFQAKSLLFTHHLKKEGRGVVMLSDDNQKRWAVEIVRLLEKRGIQFTLCGASEEAEIAPLKVDIDADNTQAIIKAYDSELSIKTNLVGRFNVDNLMTTLAVAGGLGYDLQRVANSFATVANPPGRLERVKPYDDDCLQRFAFVDYAHTPDALRNVLSTLQGVTKGRLIAVIGCGGDRDRAKRPEMGKIAATLADVVVITDDNPRSENPEDILQQILEGVRETTMEIHGVDWILQRPKGSGCVVIQGRSKAIRTTITSAYEDDIIVVAGKGHERYQLTRAGKGFFDDVLEIREAMLSWDVKIVSKALGTPQPQIDSPAVLTEVSTDSRTVKTGQIFIALKGDQFDGHKYVDVAVKSGAAALVVSEEVSGDLQNRVPIFSVDDTLKGLGDMAFFRRQAIGRDSAPVIVGITGSCGKTTVKEMTAAIFEKRWPDIPSVPAGRVLKTMGNFNNLIGLPLSLLPLELKHRAAILEMGMNQPGEIARLAQIADPDISCIVNVYGAHLEGLGTIEGVAKAKEELFAEAREDSLLIVNLDDEYVRAAASRYGNRKITYSVDEKKSKEADLWASDIRVEVEGRVRFNLHVESNISVITLGVPGLHNVSNCLTAAAIAHAAEISLEVISSGLESFRATDKRLEILKARAGYSVINDTYNANPGSMAAGLATLASMKGDVKVAILGDMFELGADSEKAHRELGAKAAKSDLAFLIVVGSFAEHTSLGALEKGMEKQRVIICDSKEDVVLLLEDLETTGRLKDDSWVLIKGSRGMRLETVVEKIVAVSHD